MQEDPFDQAIIEEQDNFPDNDKCETCGSDERIVVRLTSKFVPCQMDVFLGVIDVYKKRWQEEDYKGEQYIQNWQRGYRIIGPLACDHDDEAESKEAANV